MVLIKISCRFAALNIYNAPNTTIDGTKLHQNKQDMATNSKKVEKITSQDYAPTFGELYKSLPEPPKAPKQAFVEEIAQLCMCSQQAVRMWIQGTQRPDALKRKLIAERLGYSEETLFPTGVCKQ